jgi:uncharacterized membrane protein YedE/YeeE
MARAIEPWKASMASFDPLSALLGGALIGLASVLFMMLNGRIAGISGILGGLIGAAGDRLWRVAFVVGLIVAPLLLGALGQSVPMPDMSASWALIVAAGLLVGFGARLGGGCTSGHGVCGVARLSLRSLVATGTFMVSAAIMVALVRHVSGG